MKCPACQADALVLETRARTNNETSRRYECFNGHRFTSIEKAMRVDLAPVKRGGPTKPHMRARTAGAKVQVS